MRACVHIQMSSLYALALLLQMLTNISQVDEVMMICEDLFGNLFKCFGAADDSVAKGLLDGKVRARV